MRILFVRKESINNDFIQQLLLFHSFSTAIHECFNIVEHASCTLVKRMSKFDTEDKKLLIFVFFAYKKLFS